jgi:hypothetical protein
MDMTMPQRSSDEDDRSSLAHAHSRDCLGGCAFRVQRSDAGLSEPGHDILGGRDGISAGVEHSVEPGHLSRIVDTIQRRRTTDHHDGGWRSHLVATQI